MRSRPVIVAVSRSRADRVGDARSVRVQRPPRKLHRVPLCHLCFLLRRVTVPPEDAGRVFVNARGCARVVARDVCILSADTRTHARPLWAPADERPAQTRVAPLLLLPPSLTISPDMASNTPEDACRAGHPKSGLCDERSPNWVGGSRFRWPYLRLASGCSLLRALRPRPRATRRSPSPFWPF